MNPGDPSTAWGCRQGSVWHKKFTYEVGDPLAAVPLDGYDIELRIRRWFDTPGDPLLRVTRDDPQIVVNDDDTFEITLSALDTRTLPSTLGIAPLEAELDLIPDGDPALAFSLLAGPWPVDPEVIPVDD